MKYSKTDSSNDLIHTRIEAKCERSETRTAYYSVINNSSIYLFLYDVYLKLNIFFQIRNL